MRSAVYANWEDASSVPSPADTTKAPHQTATANADSGEHRPAWPFHRCGPQDESRVQSRRNGEETGSQGECQQCMVNRQMRSTMDASLRVPRLTSNLSRDPNSGHADGY